VDQKRKIAQRVASALIEEGKAKSEHIQITFLDLPTTSYAVGGTLVADQKSKP
jgi:phenylpyruvate tautomerase PptA (4-oxalocrotonate tautomerase family)